MLPFLTLFRKLQPHRPSFLFYKYSNSLQLQGFLLLVPLWGRVFSRLVWLYPSCRLSLSLNVPSSKRFSLTIHYKLALLQKLSITRPCLFSSQHRMTHWQLFISHVSSLMETGTFLLCTAVSPRLGQRLPQQAFQ